MRTSFMILVLAAASAAARAETPAPADARAAFERLKSLRGDWQTPAAPDAPPVTVRYELISGKTAVMETLFPGTEHEMRSLYSMDKGDLVLVHYCAMGNQPRMKYLPGSSPSELAFDFTGGANMDAANDPHIHSGRIRIVDANHIEAEWDAYAGGKKTGTKTFVLARKN
jgi:hypothetical protein